MATLGYPSGVADSRIDSNAPSAPASSTLGSADDAANLAYDAAQDRMALLPNYYRWIASHFRDHVSELIASEPTIEEVDDFLSRFDGLMQQPLALH